jgi:hypothetical protein
VGHESTLRASAYKQRQVSFARRWCSSLTPTPAFVPKRLNRNCALETKRSVLASCRQAPRLRAAIFQCCERARRATRWALRRDAAPRRRKGHSFACSWAARRVEGTHALEAAATFRSTVRTPPSPRARPTPVIADITNVRSSRSRSRTVPRDSRVWLRLALARVQARAPIAWARERTQAAGRRTRCRWRGRPTRRGAQLAARVSLRAQVDRVIHRAGRELEPHAALDRLRPA